MTSVIWSRFPQAFGLDPDGLPRPVVNVVSVPSSVGQTKLLPLYHSFNDALASKGLASEGMLYRSIADRLESESAVDVLAGSFPDSEKFVFVGLNALNECEKKVLRKMRDAHLAEFCWDFSSKEIKDPANRSSFFLAQNVAEFPQAFFRRPSGLIRTASPAPSSTLFPSPLRSVRRNCCRIFYPRRIRTHPP